MSMPLVIGIEKEDRLILLDCPFCGVVEWRVEEGENQCEKTRDWFFVVQIPWTETRWKK